MISLSGNCYEKSHNKVQAAVTRNLEQVNTTTFGNYAGRSRPVVIIDSDSEEDEQCNIIEILDSDSEADEQRNVTEITDSDSEANEPRNVTEITDSDSEAYEQSQTIEADIQRPILSATENVATAGFEQNTVLPVLPQARPTRKEKFKRFKKIQRPRVSKTFAKNLVTNYFKM